MGSHWFVSKLLKSFIVLKTFEVSELMCDESSLTIVMSHDCVCLEHSCIDSPNPCLQLLCLCTSSGTSNVIITLVLLRT